VVTPPRARPSYGIDQPNLVVGLGAAAFILVMFGVFLAGGTGATASGFGPYVAGLVCLLGSLAMIVGSLRGKPRLWRQVLDRQELRGDETALDAGTGRGLVAVELARRLPDGHVDAVDIWRGRDQTGNSREAAQLNLEVTGTAERVALHRADLREPLPFPDGHFDLVAVSLTLRSLPLRGERDEATRELARVLKPGGRLIVVDTARTAEYESVLRALDLDDVVRSGPWLSIYPPARVVTARKPGRTSTRTSGKR
jgi:SAM-dependent methyltransferase